jgi:hypothetical protein
MFRVWPRFQAWLAPEKARLEVLRGLESAAAAWSAKGQASHDLIHRGRRLAEAGALGRFDHYRRQIDRNPEAGAYLAACTGAARRRRTLAGTAAVALLAVAAGMYLLAALQPNIAALARTQLETDECLFGFCSARSITLAGKLHDDYDVAKRALTTNAGTADFSAASADVKELFAIDAGSGHALYYSGEIARVSNSNLFDGVSCVRAPSVAGKLVLDSYEASFFLYLEKRRSLPESETEGPDLQASACAGRAHGFCPQRTAWIYHLLANDLYAEAVATRDPVDQATKSHDASFYAQEAMRLYSPPGQSRGFKQCTASETLAKMAVELERAADKKAISGSPQ